VVFPELALTTFFPRWYLEHQPDIDAFIERTMPGATLLRGRQAGQVQVSALASRLPAAA
jgi:hypothetical protein